MEIKIIGEHLPITESISQYIQEKFSHLPFPEKLQHVEFRLGTQKTDQYVHFLARCQKEEFILKEKDNNLYFAIDKIMKKIHRSFTKSKEQHKLHFHKI